MTIKNYIKIEVADTGQEDMEVDIKTNLSVLELQKFLRRLIISLGVSKHG